MQDRNAPTAASPQMSRRSALKLGLAGVAAPTVITGLGTSVAQAAAPMLGASSPTHYRIKLGAFEITTLLDGIVVAPDIYPTFGQNQEEAPVRDLLKANFLPEKPGAFYFTPIVVNTGSEVILFDTGNGGSTGRRPKAGLAAERLASAGYTVDQIDTVVVTHMHPDHIGGLMEDGKPTFPNARYVTASAEYDFWSPKEVAEGPLARVGQLVQSNVVPLAEKFSFIKPGEDVATGITAIDASGHTPGQMAYMIESEGQSFMIFADVTNHYVVSLQRPDWHVRFDMDKEAAAAARKRILSMLADMRIPATGYHMPFPAVGYVEAAGNSFRWVPVTYQFEG